MTEMPCQLQTVIPKQCVPELCVLGVRRPTSNSAYPVFILLFVSLKEPVGEGMLLNCSYLCYWKDLTIPLPTECCPCEVNRRGFSQLCYTFCAINGVNAMCKLGKCPQDACKSEVEFSFSPFFFSMTEPVLRGGLQKMKTHLLTVLLQVILVKGPP